MCGRGGGKNVPIHQETSENCTKKHVSQMIQEKIARKSCLNSASLSVKTVLSRGPDK